MLSSGNATLNGSCAVLLTSGYVAIRRGGREIHRRIMLTAFGVSALFLVCYLVRVAISGTHAYPGTGAARTAYFVLLGTHMVLAVATPPLAIRSIYLAWRGRIAEHRKLVKVTLPVWLYVSVTGVLVYLMLYRWA